MKSRQKDCHRHQYIFILGLLGGEVTSKATFSNRIDMSMRGKIVKKEVNKN
jgi:hypothetical protein